MKNNLTIAAIGVALFTVASSNAQTTSQNIYEWFDNVTGIESGSIYNGPMYLNQYRSREAANNPFLGMDVYSKGDVTYDGQTFYNIDLKYDIHRDILLVKPTDNGNSRSIAMIPQKTAAFSILGRNFVNMNYEDKVPDFINGYYEQFVASPKFTFYIKHHKSVREIINNETLFSEFSPADEYLLFHDAKFHQIRSKKDVIKQFPALKNQINKFYSTTKKTSDTQFMEGLFTYLNTLLK